MNKGARVRKALDAKWERGGRAVFLLASLIIVGFLVAYVAALLAAATPTRVYRLPPVYSQPWQPPPPAYNPAPENREISGRWNGQSFQYIIQGTLTLPPVYFDRLSRLSVYLLGEMGHLKSGRLVLDGNRCVLPMNAGRASVSFEASEPCPRMDAGTVPVTINLETTQASLILKGYRHPKPIGEVLGESLCIDLFCMQGTYELRPPEELASRLDLIAYMWGLSTGQTIAWLVSPGLVLILAGAVLILLGFARSSSWMPIRASGCSFLFALGLAWTMLAVVPPFQGPDESNHFLGFAKLTGLSLEESAEALARRVHLERIKFNRDEQFVTDDQGAPFPVPWSIDQFATSPAERSSIAPAIWKPAAGLVGHLSGAQVLLVLRVIGACIFAMAIGLATLAITHGNAGAPVSFMPMLAVLCIPIFIFFASMLSDHAFLVAGFVLISAYVILVYGGGRIGLLQGVVLGLGLAIVLASPRAALPSLPFCAGLIVLHSTLARRLTRDSNGFWTGLCSGLLITLYLNDPRYIAQLARGQARPGLTTEFAAALSGDYSPVVLGSMIMGACLAGWGLEWIVKRYWTREYRAASAVGWLSRSLAVLVGLWVALSIALSIFADVPRVPNIAFVAGGTAADQPISIIEYLSEVLTSFAFFFRFDHFDFWLQTSFFGGFGWLDTVPPDSYLVAIMGLICVGTLGLYLIGDRCAPGMLTLKLYAPLGLVFTLFLYAYASYSSGLPLHGRYLIGFYLLAFGIAFAALPEVARSVTEYASRVSRLALRAEFLATGLVLFCLAINTYTWLVILARYF